MKGCGSTRSHYDKQGSLFWAFIFMPWDTEASESQRKTQGTMVKLEMATLGMVRDGFNSSDSGFCSPLAPIMAERTGLSFKYMKHIQAGGRISNFSSVELFPSWPPDGTKVTGQDDTWKNSTGSYQ